jgi:hypothetical protein
MQSSDCTLLVLTLIRMTKDEKGLAFFKGLLLKNVLSVKKLKKISKYKYKYKYIYKNIYINIKYKYLSLRRPKTGRVVGRCASQ